VNSEFWFDICFLIALIINQCSTLQEKLKKARGGQAVASSAVVENFLSMIDKNANSATNVEAQDNTNNSSANRKLRQLLDQPRRTDAVAAS
jgi:hypothetical protein